MNDCARRIFGKFRAGPDRKFRYFWTKLLLIGVLLITQHAGTLYLAQHPYQRASNIRGGASLVANRALPQTFLFFACQCTIIDLGQERTFAGLRTGASRTGQAWPQKMSDLLLNANKLCAAARAQQNKRSRDAFVRSTAPSISASFVLASTRCANRATTTSPCYSTRSPAILSSPLPSG